MAKILVNNSGPLHGEVWISGAKNSVLPLLAATIMTTDTCVIEDVPDLADVNVMKKMLLKYGAKIDDAEEGTIRISTPEIISCEGDRELVQEMRASLFTMGPMLARHGKIVMPMPGGCTIGRRPIDLHLKGFRALGAEVTVPTLDGKVKYTIHEGTQPGDVFKLKDRGIQNLNGRGRGDQLVRVEVEVPRKLNERQKELLRAFARLRVRRVRRFPTFLEQLPPLPGADYIILSCYDSEEIRQRMAALRRAGCTAELILLPEVPHA